MSNLQLRRFKIVILPLREELMTRDKWTKKSETYDQV